MDVRGFDARQVFKRRARENHLPVRVDFEDHVTADFRHDAIETLTLVLPPPRLFDIGDIAADRNDTQGTIGRFEGCRHTVERMPDAIGKAQAKVASPLLARFDPRAIGIVEGVSIVRVQPIEEPALLQGLAENLIEGAGDEPGKARVRGEQVPLVVKFENQVRRIRSERCAAELGIAQPDGLLGGLLSKPSKFVDELRSAFLLVAVQWVPSRWKTSQSAPT